MGAKPISLKQKRFTQIYLKGGNGTEAASLAYGYKNRRVASERAVRNLKSPLVQNYMRELLDQAGLSDKDIADNLKKIVTAGVGEDSLAKAKPADALRALEMSSKLKDLFPAERKQVESRTMSLSLQGKTESELQGVLTQLRKELKEFQLMTQKTAALTPNS